MNGGKLVINTELGTKNFDRQYEQLKRKLEEIETVLSDKTIDYEIRLKNEAEAEKIKNQMTEIELRAKRAGEQTDKSFTKSANILKNFALRLFGIGTAFGIVSRASSAYLSQNEEVANKLKSIWTFLGELIGPVIDFIADNLLRLIGYINVFIKALTGVDLVARANAKALKKQADAQNQLNKATQQYDFDVIRTQTGTTSSSGSISGGGSGLLEIPELNQGIVQKLQDLAKWIKENHKWLLALGGAFLLFFTGSKLASLLKGFAGIIGGAGTGLAGIGALLKGLLTIGTIAIGVELIYDAITGRKLIEDIQEIIKGAKELDETFKKNEEGERKFTERLEDNSEKLEENAKAGKLTKEQIDKLVSSYNDSNNSIKYQIQNLKDSNTIFYDTSGEIEEVAKQTNLYTDAIGELYKQGLLNNDQIQIYYNMLFDQIYAMDLAGKETDELKKQYENLTGQKYEIVFETKVRENALTQIKTMLNTIKNLFPSSSSVLDNLLNKMTQFTYSTKSYSGETRGYALGGIVTQPTRAIIGEAGYNEYIVPEREDYLSRLASMIGQYNGGGPTNVYLDGRLIQRQVSKKQNQVDFSTNS